MLIKTNKLFNDNNKPAYTSTFFSISLFLILSALSIFLFHKALQQPFVGDDWWWIYNAKYIMNSYPGWISAFFRENGSGFYRPITQNLFFFIMYHAFGLRSFFYNVSSMIVYLLTGLVVLKILYNFHNDLISATAGLCAFLFSSTNYVLLSWPASFSQTGSGLFFALALYFYIRDNDHKKYSYLFFILCLMSGEITSTLPAFVLFYELLIKKASFLRSIFNTVYFWLILCFYIVLRLYVIGLHEAGPFGPNYRISAIARTLKNVFVFIFGLTPTFINSINENVWSIISMSTISILLSFLIFLIISNMLTILKTKNHIWRFFILGVSWIVLGSLPVVLFSSRDFAKYTLELSLIGYSVLIYSLIYSVRVKSFRIFIAVSISMIFFLIGFCSIYNPYGNNNVQGTNVLGSVSDNYAKYISYCNSKYKEKFIYVITHNKNIRWIVSGQWEARVILNERYVKTYFIRNRKNGDVGAIMSYNKNKLDLLCCK